MAAFGEAWRNAEEEANRLTYEQVFLLLEFGASEDELSAFLAEASKGKKALEFDASFDVIFNYGYSCCSFAHNICGSKLGIPDGMSDTSKPLPPNFFINPRCPPGAVPVEAVVAPEAGISKGVKHSSTAGPKVGDNPDSLSRVAKEREEPGVSGKS